MNICVKKKKTTQRQGQKNYKKKLNVTECNQRQQETGANDHGHVTCRGWWEMQSGCPTMKCCSKSNPELLLTKINNSDTAILETICKV